MNVSTNPCNEDILRGTILSHFMKTSQPYTNNKLSIRARRFTEAHTHIMKLSLELNVVKKVTQRKKSDYTKQRLFHNDSNDVIKLPNSC